MRVLHLGRKFIRAHAEYAAFCERHTVVNLEIAGQGCSATQKRHAESRQGYHELK